MILGAGSRRLRGFTIVEVLMVVAVISILFALVMLATVSLRRTAARKATQSMIERLKLQLDEYRSIKGTFPPDGFDFEVKNREGRPIWGAACLYEFLARDFEVEETVGGQVRRTKHPPLISDFRGNELTKENEENEGIREVVDGFGLPFHYDNTEDSNFDPKKQESLPHMEDVEAHTADPRTDSQMVAHVGIQRTGAFDLWSHGDNKAHSDPEEHDLNQTIGTWNVELQHAKSGEEKSK